MFIAVGLDGILTSPDGITWTQKTSDSGLLGIVYGNGLYVAVGLSGKILTSPNGSTWTPRGSGTINPLDEVTYGKGMFVVVGYWGTILTSINGVTWTPRISGTANTLLGVTYGSGMFVSVGDTGTILTSTNGVTWTQGESFTTNLIEGITHVNGTFVTVGINGTILESDPVTYSLKVKISGKGNIVSALRGINCKKYCIGAYLFNDRLTLKAAPAKGYKFIGWSGACKGKKKSCKVTMDKANALSAKFKKK